MTINVLSNVLVIRYVCTGVGSSISSDLISPGPEIGLKLKPQFEVMSNFRLTADSAEPSRSLTIAIHIAAMYFG
jgi:hypothetical protein